MMHDYKSRHRQKRVRRQILCMSHHNHKVTQEATKHVAQRYTLPFIQRTPIDTKIPYWWWELVKNPEICEYDYRKSSAGCDRDSPRLHSHTMRNAAHLPGYKCSTKDVPTQWEYESLDRVLKYRSNSRSLYC
jgi:hypothetical protein